MEGAKVEFYYSICTGISTVSDQWLSGLHGNYRHVANLYIFLCLAIFNAFDLLYTFTSGEPELDQTGIQNFAADFIYSNWFSMQFEWPLEPRNNSYCYCFIVPKVYQKGIPEVSISSAIEKNG